MQATTSAALFCKCTCLTNSTIIPLPLTMSCNGCTRQFCLNYRLPICKSAKEEEVATTCFRNSPLSPPLSLFPLTHTPLETKSDYWLIAGLMCVCVWGAVVVGLQRETRSRTRLSSTSSSLPPWACSCGLWSSRGLPAGARAMPPCPDSSPVRAYACVCDSGLGGIEWEGWGGNGVSVKIGVYDPLELDRRVCNLPSPPSQMETGLSVIFYCYLSSQIEWYIPSLGGPLM